MENSKVGIYSFKGKVKDLVKDIQREIEIRKSEEVEQENLKK